MRFFFAVNLVQAREALSKRHFELVILDILVPSIPEGLPSQQAGEDFLRELRISSVLIKPSHVLGLTAHDSIIGDSNGVFDSELWRLIKYDVTSERWELQLRSKIDYLIRAKQDLQAGGQTGYDFDLAIITALWKPEFSAVRNLPLSWREQTFLNDQTKYLVATVEVGGKQKKIVAASCSQMGIASASVLTMKMIEHFRPRYIGMCGIAAGVREAGANLGDILVVEQSWDYGSGKISLDGNGVSTLLPDPHHIPITADLRERFARCLGEGHDLSEIQRSWTGPKPVEPLRAWFGPVASGASVVQDKGVVKGIQTHSRKLIGLEMETYGVFFAAENCCTPRPEVFAVKSVVDFADETKTDSVHDYASFTSAQFLWKFTTEHLIV